MPYRIDLQDARAGAWETLIDLGALDVEALGTGVAAIVPDSLPVEVVRAALAVDDFRVSQAAGRDDESVWRLSAGPATVAGIALKDSAAFGTGLHPTTTLCLDAIEMLTEHATPAGVLDVGTGSGILALSALRHGVVRAVALDVEPAALQAAAANARLNRLEDRLWLVRGGPDAVRGSWPLVLANIRAAELMSMASTLVRRVASRGYLVLSGIPQAVGPDVTRAYTRLGLVSHRALERGGWTLLVLRPSW